jgi:tetratricopeptide (TPR) repeat protein
MVDTDIPTTYRLPPVPGSIETVSRPSPLFTRPPTPATSRPDAKANEAPSIPAPARIPVGPPDDGQKSTGDVGKGVKGDNAAVASAPAETAATEVAKAEVAASRVAPKVVVAQKEIPPVVATSRSPQPTVLTTQLLPAVQRGFGLAQRGALYAARTEFVQVLRRVAQALDNAADTSEHSRALAAGLRALDEAEDFVPPGVQMEAELDVRTTASSHRTKVLPPEPEEVSPLEAVALYHSYAQERLKRAVAGEQTGSMALHGLGTIYTRLALRKDDDVQLTRSAMTMYSAALAACPNNHLAANELGVLVCRSGRAEEAAALFMRTINFAPSAVAYHNLAVAQQRSGLVAQAAANELESQRLAAMERSRGDVSRRAGVRWVTAQEMARASQTVHRTPERAVRLEAPPPPPTKSAWRRVVESTKALPFPGGLGNENPTPMPVDHVARPMELSTGSETQWR